MAVMQTPHGRVIGLIVRKDDQPGAQAVEAAEANEAEANTEAKATAAKRGRAAKK